jgi:uncharacterized protein
VLRSYKPRGVGQNPYDYLLWEAVRATTAAPLYSEPITLEASQKTCVGGGILANNLIFEIEAEARRIWGKREIGCLISLGTGFVITKGLREKKQRV